MDPRYAGKTDQQRSGIITRAFRLLRNRGIIAKVPERRRYKFSTKGCQLIKALQADAQVKGRLRCPCQTRRVASCC
jgi:DNA-binding HxlR family transcriptional regulator